MLDLAPQEAGLSEAVLPGTSQLWQQVEVGVARVICPQCREEFKPEPWTREIFGNREDVRGFKGRGCEACKGLGYRGRTAVQELLEMDDALRNVVSRDGSIEQLEAQAVQSGMIPMRRDGLDKVIQGVTTLEEVLRVC